MKVMTILGTRPEIIRTSRITTLLDKHCDHIIVHTNQNFTHNLKDLFFEQLGLRQPDITLYTSMSDGNTHTEYGLGRQLGDMFPAIEKTLKEVRPEKVFILGDTNSALCTIMCERMGIPVYHMEAANRSFNREIPEEVNRRLIDHTASYNLFYTATNRHTLLMEGCQPDRIFQCGNPTMEVLDYYQNKIDASTILDAWTIYMWETGYASYILADIHRSENVNNPQRLRSIFRSFEMVADTFKTSVYVSVHPKTKDKITELEIPSHPRVHLFDPIGFFDFVRLEQYARIILTDSGLVSEEACIMRKPCVIVRNETERPEVVEAGGAIIAGTDAENIVRCTQRMMDLQNKNWQIPEGYGWDNVSERVVNYILSR